MAKTVFGALMLVAATVGTAGAAPIDYFYSGQVSANVGGTTYSGPGELVGHADTTTVVTLMPLTRYNQLTSLMLVIPNVFTATVLGPTYADVYADVFEFALGSPTGTALASSFPTHFYNYSLAANLSPTTLVEPLDISGTVATTVGSVSFSFRNTQLAAAVPEPATASLVLIGLAAGTGLGRRGRVKRQPCLD